MSTAPADERLSAYLDGELTDEEVEHLEADLARDAALRAELKRLRAVVRFLHDEGPVRAPLGFHNAVMARIDEEHPVRAPWWAWLRRPFGMPMEGLAVAAVALLVLAVVGWPGGEAPPEGEAPVWRDVPAEPDAAPAAMKAPKMEAEEAVPEPPRPAPQTKREASTKEVSPEEPAAADKGAGVDEEPAPKPDVTGRSVPKGYVVVTEDVGALRTLLAVVGKLGGTVTTASGQPVASATMASSSESFSITMPSDALASFESELTKLGMLQRDFDDKLYYGEEVSVAVTLQLAGGGVGTVDDGPPNAARSKKAMEYDMEQALPEVR